MGLTLFVSSKYIEFAMPELCERPLNPLLIPHQPDVRGLAAKTTICDRRRSVAASLTALACGFPERDFVGFMD
jgi:hypothetical protein